MQLYDKLGQSKFGELIDTIEAYVEEERNGLFELELTYPSAYPLADKLEKENIIIANANDTLRSQKFRIYDTRKFLDGTITVFARHISFDLMYDIVNNVTFENQSCEYALNQLFRQSQFSTHYRGYSDIVNAQSYSMSMCNILEAIGGKEGSIIDTFGTGAEILRDNEKISVLNKRGHDNSVSIEYAKNLTGFELEEDTTDLVTRIIPYAKYTEQTSTKETKTEITLKGDTVDSPLINNYSHPYVKHIDYSDKFEDGVVPTKEKLTTFARNEFKNNKVDIPKMNFKIDFIPLSKCVGYEGLDDKISLCDTVTIRNSMYNIDTKAKVIKYKFNVLADRYESMELGEPRTKLGDIIGGGGSGEDGKPGPPGPPGPPGEDGNIGDFPDTLPSKSVLTGKSIGLASIELMWTFENKVYYGYELYASKTPNFTPNSFDLIFEGQASSYLYQVKPNETWYFKVCAINSYGNRNAFSDQISVSTSKINGEEWIEKATIGQALIGELSADVITSGKFTGHYIDARNLSVTDGNGKRTLDIDSFGNVALDVTSFKIKSYSVDTSSEVTDKVNSGIGSANSYTDSRILVVNNSISSKVSKVEYDANKEIVNQKFTEVKQTTDSIASTVSNNYHDKNYIDNEFAWMGKEDSRIEQKADSISLEVSKKVGVEEVKSTIRQSATDIRIGFNGIDNRIEMTTDGMFFNNALNQRTISLKRGYMHLYNPSDSTLMGGTTPRSTVGGSYLDNGISTIISNNGYYYSIAKANDWNNDTQSTFNPNEYLIVNFRDRGSQKMGVNIHTNLYAHNGLNVMGKAIVNASSIQCNQIKALDFLASNTNKTMFSSTGYIINNFVGWDWKKNNILDPVIIGGSYGYSVINNNENILNSKGMNTFDEIEIVNHNAKNSTKQLDVSNVTNKDAIMLNGDNADLGKLVTLLFEEVKNLKNEIEILKTR